MEVNKIIHAKFGPGSGLPDNCIDAIPCDPPYGIRFMGKKWDYEIPSVEIWQECYRVLKPGGHMLVACGTRTQHRMAVNIEDAGFEIRDVICWHYGSGFPKSLDISKAIDKAAGVAFMSSPSAGVGFMNNEGRNGYNVTKNQLTRQGDSTEEAKKWNGYGTALKPATEFWTLARKPLEENTIAANVIRYGTGGLNIDACRIQTDDALGGGSTNGSTSLGKEGWERPWMSDEKAVNAYSERKRLAQVKGESLGRFPANVIFDPFMGAELDKQTGVLTSGNPCGKVKTTKNRNAYGAYAPGQDVTCYGDSGGASRFFYCPKPDAGERGEYNNHATVKPLALMQYLIKMICPLEPGRIVLDPFAGSGTTLIAARQLGLDFVAYEMEEAHIPIIEQRLKDHLGMFL